MHKVIIIAGPTASGKSAHAMKIAEQENGVIINADSVQIYNGLPILTAQPDENDKAAIPHELYGIRDPNEACSAGNWREMVEPVIQTILSKGQTPIVVGGSGLYIKSLMDGFSPIPDIPENIRQQAIDLQARLGNPAFHAELEKIDPVMAKRFHSHHTARLVRAYEVILATGKSLSEWQSLPSIKAPDDWFFDVTLVMPNREKLYDRCDKRFHIMLERGALDEVAAFDAAIENGTIRADSLLCRALGADALRSYLKGSINKESAIEKGQLETRQYAKRQMTWFRNQVKSADNIKVSWMS